MQLFPTLSILKNPRLLQKCYPYSPCKHDSRLKIATQEVVKPLEKPVANNSMLGLLLDKGILSIA